MSDFQYIQRLLDSLIIDEFTAQDDHSLGPAQIHEYLSQVMYGRRTKMNPLWNSLLVGGFKDGERYGQKNSFLKPFVSHFWETSGSSPTLISWAPHTPLRLLQQGMAPILLNHFFGRQSKAMRMC